MKIEEELKQTNFDSEIHKATLNIVVTASWLSSQMHLILKPFGISKEQFNVLRILRGQHPKPSSLGLITDRMVDKMSNATRLVDKLKQGRLVSREICPTNRRKVDIRITKKGLDLLDQIDPVVISRFEELQTVNDTELEVLNDILDRMRG